MTRDDRSVKRPLCLQNTNKQGQSDGVGDSRYINLDIFLIKYLENSC